MRVVLLGAFKVPAAGGLMARVTIPSQGPDGLVYDAHQSQMAALRGQEVAGSSSTPWGVMTLLEGSTEFGTIRIEVDVADRDALHALEPEIGEAASGLLHSRYGPPERSSVGYPVGCLLWWHRLLLEPGDDQPRAIRLFGKEFMASDVVSGCVADGFTTLETSDPDVVREVECGLVAATEDWLMVDDLSRRLTHTLIVAKGDEEVLGFALALAEGLTEEITLAMLLVDERRRHLTNATARSHRAAVDVWGVAEVRESLLRNAESVQALIRVEHGRRSARSDARRNSILFGFTAVTVLQSVLLMVDFASDERLQLASATRLALAALVLVLTVGILVRYMRAELASSELPTPVATIPTRRMRRRP